MRVTSNWKRKGWGGTLVGVPGFDDFMGVEKASDAKPGTGLVVFNFSSKGCCVGRRQPEAHAWRQGRWSNWDRRVGCS